MNQDFLNVSELKKILYSKYKLSITFVDEKNPPEYPKYCDVINAWCYSAKTPRCPFDVARFFKNISHSEAKNW